MVHVLDPRRVEQALGVTRWPLPRSMGYQILVGTGPEQVMLSFQDNEPDSVHVFLPHGQESSVVISLYLHGITRVAYDDERHEVVIERHDSLSYAVLSVSGHGQVDFVMGLDEAQYEGTAYDERFRELTEPHDRRLQELRTMPYQEYLATPEWQARRVEQLKRASFRCQVCNATDTELHVHHRTYERRGNEAPGDLVALCQACHELFHAHGRLADPS